MIIFSFSSPQVFSSTLIFGSKVKALYMWHRKEGMRQEKVILKYFWSETPRLLPRRVCHQNLGWSTWNIRIVMYWILSELRGFIHKGLLNTCLIDTVDVKGITWNYRTCITWPCVELRKSNMMFIIEMLIVLSQYNIGETLDRNPLIIGHSRVQTAKHLFVSGAKDTLERNILKTVASILHMTERSIWLIYWALCDDTHVYLWTDWQYAITTQPPTPMYKLT